MKLRNSRERCECKNRFVNIYHFVKCGDCGHVFGIKTSDNKMSDFKKEDSDAVCKN